MKNERRINAAIFDIIARLMEPFSKEAKLKFSLTRHEKKVLWFILFLTFLGLITLWLEHG